MHVLVPQVVFVMLSAISMTYLTNNCNTVAQSPYLKCECISFSHTYLSLDIT